MCLFNFPLFARIFPHWSHSTLIAVFSSSESLQNLSWLLMHETLKLLPQVEHNNFSFSPCTVFVCSLRRSIETNHFEQTLQKDLTFSFWVFCFDFKSWVLTCLFSFFWFEHTFEHWSHTTFSISFLLWFLIWRTKLALFENIFPHRLQIYCSGSYWWDPEVPVSLTDLPNGSFSGFCNKFTGSTSSFTETTWRSFELFLK